MKILVLGSVAKEHALVRWISQSKEEVKVYAYPGNPGMNGLATVIKRSDLSDVDAVVNIVKSEKIDLIITSTAKLIEEGVTEELQKLGVKLLGPGREAFAFENLQTLRERAKRYGIKTLEKAQIVTTDEELKNALDTYKNRMISIKPVVGKGKNRLDTASRTLAYSFASEYLKTTPVLIEEFIDGLTVTATVLSDSEQYRLFPMAVDYYKSMDDDSGYFSSGMGALSPLPLSRYTRDRVGEEVIKKMMRGLKNDNINYKGFLTFHLLITSSGDVYLLNMKTRFSDPSATGMLALTTSDAVKEFKKALDGTLEPEELESIPNMYALGVVVASKGYPEESECKKEIVNLEEVEDYLLAPKSSDYLYFGAVDEENGTLYTNGGRPFTLVVEAESIERANKKAYLTLYEMQEIFHGAWYRRDIGTNFFLF